MKQTGQTATNLTSPNQRRALCRCVPGLCPHQLAFKRERVVLCDRGGALEKWYDSTQQAYVEAKMCLYVAFE